MGWVIYAMFAVAIVVIVFSFISLSKLKNTATYTNAEKFDVFKVSGNQFIVLTLSPITYEINDIERIDFSISKVPRSVSSYSGVMRVIMKNGKKSRPFIFDSSAYTKKATLSSSKQQIEQTIQYLMDELKQHHIYCLHTV